MQPLRVVFNNTIGAADVLAAAKVLKRSAPNVFFNPDQTKAEAQLAFEERNRRRIKRRERDNQQKSDTTTNATHTSNASRTNLGTTVTATLVMDNSDVITDPPEASPPFSL